ncbi:MAG: FAD-dependent oxidoreductase [Proteobacteria bacterium]|nr:FAD-dependent oxidoreductase [Burkholderiales bacterium]
MITRRRLLKAGSAAATLAAAGCATIDTLPPAGGRVVVVGGGYGGLTAANHLRQFAPEIEVVLIERASAFVSCPLSNRLLAGTMQIAELTRPYDTLAQARGVKIVRDEVLGIDAERKTVTLARGGPLRYDRVIVSPGVDFTWNEIPGMAKDPAAATQVVPHAWHAGPQTLLLRRQLEAMPDGGVVVLHVPLAPYRCPPGPYERASQIAWYLWNTKRKSKILILDSNDAITSKPALFAAAWKNYYPGMIEHRPNSRLLDVDLATRSARLEFDTVKADVLNVIPPQKAARIAETTGLITTNARWCEVDFVTYESTRVKGVHVLGDAILAAPAMPKSGHMANQHAKVCAAAVVELMRGQAPYAAPVLINTCYSFLTELDTIRVSSVHRYDAGKRTMLTVPGSGGVSAAPSALEGTYALQWAQNIWANMLA